MAGERTVHPDCINASNPYHECVEYCFRKILEAKAKAQNPRIFQRPRLHSDVSASSLSAILASKLSKDLAAQRRAHPDCINASNPYHECAEYCFRKSVEAKAKVQNPRIFRRARLPYGKSASSRSAVPEGEFSKDMAGERRAHPDCINASNPYHECVEYCLRKIVEAKDKAQRDKELEGLQAGSASGSGGGGDQYVFCIPDEDKNQYLLGTDSEEE